MRLRTLLRRLRARAAGEAAELRRRAGQRGAVLTPCPPASPPSPGPSEFGAERSWALLQAQCEMGPRIPGSDGHRRTLAWLTAFLGGLADEVALQSWQQRIYRGAGGGTRLPMTNVLARIRGRSPGPGLMLATHWDTRPVADQDPDPARRGEPVPGANDGASGVAVLLEAARALAAERPARDVLIALFDGEDLGEHYYGSRLFARTATRGAWRPAAAIVVDMVGKRGLRCTTEAHSRSRAPREWSALMATAAALGLEDHFGGAEAAINDDHVSLLRVGIPAVLLIDYAFPQWHTTHDRPEHCDAASLAAVGRVLVRRAREWR